MQVATTPKFDAASLAAFREVAPCCNNRHVAERYARNTKDGLDETLGHSFSLRLRTTPVTLRLRNPASGPLMHLPVQRSGPAGQA